MAHRGGSAVTPGFGWEAASSRRQDVREAHDAVGDESHAWDNMFEDLQFRGFRQINLGNCYCPLGCCRLVDAVCYSIERIFVYRGGSEIEILGTKNQEERRDISGMFRFRIDHGASSGYDAKTMVVRFKTRSNSSLLDEFDVEEGLEDEQSWWPLDYK